MSRSGPRGSVPVVRRCNSVHRRSSSCPPGNCEMASRRPNHRPVAVADRGVVIFATRDLPPDIARVATADDLGIARLVARGTGRTAAWLPVRPVLGDAQP